MGLRTTCKMVAFHHTGETLAFTGANHINVFTDAKNLNGQFISGLKPGIFCAEFTQKTQRRQFALLEVTKFA